MFNAIRAWLIDLGGGGSLRKSCKSVQKMLESIFNISLNMILAKIGIPEISRKQNLPDPFSVQVTLSQPKVKLYGTRLTLFQLALLGATAVLNIFSQCKMINT